MSSLIRRQWYLRGAKCSSRWVSLQARSAAFTNSTCGRGASPRRDKERNRTFSTSSSANKALTWLERNEVDIVELHEPGNGRPKLRSCLRDHKNTKWGFLIYRCDYRSDESWAKFMSTYRWNVYRSLEYGKATDLRSSLEFTVKEDKTTLDGADVDRVREIFQDWTQGDEAKEELRDAPYNGPFCYVRYTYCVHVDADAVDSVVNRAPQPPIPDHEYIGYVNLVRLRLEDVMTVDYGPSYDPEEEDDDKLDDVEGDQNLVKFPVANLSAEMYGELFSMFFTFDRMRTCCRAKDGVSLYPF